VETEWFVRSVKPVITPCDTLPLHSSTKDKQMK